MGSENSRAYITFPEIPFPRNRSHFMRHHIYEFPFTNLSDPKFWSEFYLSILHLFDENQKPSEKFVTPHTPRQLFELFYGCSDILPNPLDILEAIIQKSIVKNRTSYTLSLLFDFHQKYSFVRFHSFLVTKSYFGQVDFLNTLRDSKGNTFPYDIQTLTNIISKLDSLLNSKKVSLSSEEIDEIQKVSHAMNHALPPNEITAPVYQFFSNHPGQRMSFMAHNVYPHCITSNGNFIFILTDSSVLYIFPLICNGSILPPITRKMNFKIPVNQLFSIASCSTYLFIFSSKFKRIYRISDLLSSLEEDINDYNTLYGIFNSRHTSTVNQNDPYGNGNANISDSNIKSEKIVNIPENENSQIGIDDNEHSYVISDGMIIAQLSGVRSCQINLFDSQTRRILNYKSSLKTLNYSKPIALTPITISGAYISFISHVDQQTFIMKVFSLLTGQTIIEEQFNTIDQILAVTIDSINHCSYAIISGINGNMEVRRFSFYGSYTPFLFNFSFKIYNTEKKIKKKNAFKAVASSFNILTIQLLGTHIIPPPLLATDHSQVKTIVDTLKKLAADVPADAKIKIYYTQSLQFLASLIDLNLRNLESKITNARKEAKRSSEILPDSGTDKSDDKEKDFEDKIFRKELIKEILAIVPSLPTNIGSFIFFMHLPLFFEISIEQSITILYHLFDAINNSYLANFCLNQLEKCEEIARIPFDNDNSLSLLIPSKLDPVNSISRLFISVLFIHQHVLISSTYQYLETSSPIIIINDNSSNKDKGTNDDDLSQFEQFHSKGEKTQIDYFLDYAYVVINRFITAISGNNNSKITQVDVFQSLIFKIFDNFLRTLSLLSNSNQITQPIAILLSKAIQKLAVIPNGIHKDQRLINNSINFVYYVFAKYIASLVKGGGQCGMEKNFYWLIKSNHDLSEKHDSEWINHLDSSELDYFDDEKIRHFINNSFPVSKSDKKKKNKKKGDNKADKVKLKNIDVDKLMDLLYNKYKKQFNRRLSKDIQQFDRIVLMATAKHSKIVHDILKFNEKSTLTPEIKAALDQMIRIRSAYRQIIQRKGDTKGIMRRALFLCRINPCSTDVKSLGEFITSHINVSALVKIILLQPSKIQITIAGFSLMSKMIELKTENNIYLNCISDCLSSIDDFSGFSSIVLSTNLSEKQKSKVYQFFSNIFKIYKNVRNPQLILIPFRFFRHLNRLHSLQAKLFLKVNDILKDDVDDLPIFSIDYLLVKKFSKVSRHKLKNDKDDNNDPFLSKDFNLNFDLQAPVNWLLLSAYLNINYCSEDLFTIIAKYFWKLSRSDNESLVTPRVICQVIYNAFMNDNNSSAGDDASSASQLEPGSFSNASANAMPIGNRVQEITIAKFIKKALVFISHSLLGCDLKLNKFAIELVYLFRKIINSAPLSDLDTKPSSIATTILNDMMNEPKYLKATLAIIGLQVDIVRPYVLIRQNFRQKEYSPNASLIRKSSAESPLQLQTNNKSSARLNLERNNLSSSRLLLENIGFTPSSSTTIDYIAIPNGKDLKFVPLPFDIKSPSLSLKNADVHAFPLLEVNANVLSSFGNYVLSFMENFSGTNKSKSKLNKMFNDLVVQNLYIQTISYLSIRPEFVNGITKEFIGILSSKMELFSSINDLFDDAISIVSQIEEVDDEIDGLYKIQGDKYNSYLTKPLINYVPDKHQKLSFTIDAKSDPNDIDLYFGIVSDSFYQHNIRYELIHYPSGWHYPVGKQYKKIKFPLNIEINIDERSFTANTTKFNFPQGTRFRFVISSMVDDKSKEPKFTVASNDNYISFFKENDSDVGDDGYNNDEFDDDEYFEYDEEKEKIGKSHVQDNKLKTNYFLKDSPEDNEDFSKIPSEIFLKVKDYHSEHLNDPSKLSLYKNDLIPRSYDDITPVDYEIPTFSKVELMRSYYISPLDEIPLHIFDSKKASKHLIRVIWNSYIYKLSGQFATICLMRIALNNPFQLMLQQSDSDASDLSNISELFINLILSTESFHPELFANKKFFFGLDSPPWLSQSLTANSSQNVVSGYESEALEALNTLINLDEDHGNHEDDDDDSFQSDSSSYRSRESSDISLMKKSISKEIVRGVAKRIFHLASKPRCHLCAVQNPYVHLYLKECFKNKTNSFDIDEIPEFDQNSLLATPEFQSKLADYPIFLGPMMQTNESYNYMSNFNTVSCIVKNSDSIFINVKRYDNSWVKDTIFELLLLFKNFMYIAQDSDLEIFLRSVLIELYVSGSPFARPFNVDFMTKIYLQHPVSPIYATPSYLQKLSILGTYLQTLPPSQTEYVTRNSTSNSISPTLSNALSNATSSANPSANPSAAPPAANPPIDLTAPRIYSLDLNTDDFFRLVYRIDAKMVNDPVNKRVIKHFPEFFTFEDQIRINEINQKLGDEKVSNKCRIRRVCIDPGAIKSTDTVVDELLLMVKIQQRYKSIVGFPFWEILPYYYRLLKENEEKIEKDFIPPTVYKDKNGIVIVDNQTGVPLHISLDIVHGNFYSSSVLMYSVSPLFEVAEYVTNKKIDEVITIKEGKTYFSMTGFRGVWKIRFIDEFLHKHKKGSYEYNSTDTNNNDHSLFRKESDKTPTDNDEDYFEIDVDEIKKTFINDMKMFACEWKSVDTEALSNQIPPNGIKNKRFQTVSSIAESFQQLTNKYSPIVVKLRALFIHHFNYFLYVSSQATDRYSPYFHSKVAMDIPDRIKMLLKEWVSDEEASKSLFDAIKCNESYREITINRFLSKRLVEEGIGTFNDSIIAQLSRQFGRFDPSLFRNKTRPWSVTFEEEKAIDAGGPMRELMTEVARSIFLPSSEIFIPIREFFIPFPTMKAKANAEVENENATTNTNANATNTNTASNLTTSGGIDNDDDKIGSIQPQLNHRYSIRRNSNSSLNIGSVPIGTIVGSNSRTGRRRNSNDDIRTSQSLLSIESTYNESCKEMKMKMYWAVGQFIAIIVRTGFPQSLPFAPLVWKYIAEAKITREDVFASDPEFALTMKKILQKPDLYLNSPELQNWQTTQWDGSVVTLPQYQSKNQSALMPMKTQANQIIFTTQNNNNNNNNVSTFMTKYRNQKRNPQVNIYVNECIRYRIDSILPMLKEIRNGFTANVGFEFNPILSGPLLSHLAQGSDIITVEQLKFLTVPLDFDGEGEMQYIDRFWRVVERFTSLQRHHMLRFITTLTRIPITTKSQFGIKIDKFSTSHPDTIMPTASTCFNKLHWPCYSNDDIAYEKFSFAIENCQSLDLT